MNQSGIQSEQSLSIEDRSTSKSISSLQAQLDSFQKSGKFQEGIIAMEKILVLKKEQFGEDSNEFKKGVEKLCQLLNMSSMIYLEMEQFEKSLDQLRKAEMLQNNSQKMKAVTYNNMACYYRRTKKLRTALNYLLNALEIELKLEDNDVSLADTHLNLCAVLSQLDKHEDALQHSMLSIIMLQDEMLNSTLQFYKNNISQQQQQLPNNTNNQDQQDIQTVKKRKIVSDDRIAVLAIAYHNLGVEFEHLKRDDESMKLYSKAYGFANNYLGSAHSVVKKMEKVMRKAQEQRQDKMRKVDVKNSQIMSKNNGKLEFYKETNRTEINSIGSKPKILPKLRIHSPLNMQNPYGVDTNSQIYGIQENMAMPPLTPTQNQSKKLINYSYSHGTSPKTPKTTKIKSYKFGYKPDSSNNLYEQQLQQQYSHSPSNKFQSSYEQILTRNSSQNKTRNYSLSQSSDSNALLNFQNDRLQSPVDSLNEQAKTVFRWNQSRNPSQSYEGRSIEELFNGDTPTNGSIQKQKNKTRNHDINNNNNNNKISQLNNRIYKQPLQQQQHQEQMEKSDYHDLYSEQPPPSHRDIRQSFIDIHLKQSGGRYNSHSQNTSTNNNQVRTPIRETLEQEFTQNSSITQNIQQQEIIANGND